MDIMKELLTTSPLDGFEALIGGLIVVAIIILFIAIIIYIIEAIFLTKFHKLLYGKGTALAWIPFANIYLLGKLTFNKLIGWILLGATIVLGSSTTTTINGETIKHQLIPGGSGIMNIVRIGFWIYAIVKYIRIKNGEIPVEVARAQSDSSTFDALKKTPSQNNNMGNSVNNMQQNTMNNGMDTPQNMNSGVQQTPNATKYCTNCGAQLSADSAFCTSCGTKQG